MSDCLGNPEGTPHTIYPCFIGVDSYCPVSPAPCPPASTFSLSRPEPNLIMSDGKKMTSSRRHHLKSLMLQIAATWIETEKQELVEAKQNYMAENCPNPDMSGDLAALMEICKKLSQAADKIDDERYDVESKVVKANKEIEDLRMKVVELGGVKKPALKKVRMSADAMLQALLGGKHKVTMDLRSNLKQVKKEVKEESVEAGDWRKNIEDKADRKKMFETS
ncbi:troponin I, fast skeletal muscle-like [Gadus chalcogrammus]|uniref:troponin I, fast skeletal muscle-like n=2 Tax=Gadus TaxID=8048 RepID=UPI0024C4D246|nr:troponin I, fast skeletal muscle-like [Gadus chalcogrammus]